MTISKMWTAVRPAQYSTNSNNRRINDPKKGTFLYQWLKPNLYKSHEFICSKSEYFHISHVTSSKM